jgi:hypothetical protein
MEKINIAELLKNCPSGMELDCTMYDNLYFDKVVEDFRYPIGCYTIYDGCRTSVNFTEFGEFNNYGTAKCVIFPKGKNTWKGFQRPFKDGDIVATTNGLWIGITTGGYSGSSIPTYCVIHSDESFEAYLNYKKKWVFERLANEEEKEKLFKAIKDNGYKWNAETKTLELIEPKFKVGNRIKNIDNCRSSIVVEIKDDCFIIKTLDGLNNSYLTDKLSFSKQDEWELVPNKFDITTFKPFDKVLVRCSSLEKWRIQFFEKYDKTCKFPFICMGYNKYKQCIPYNDNEHLLDKTDECDEFYKIW